MLSALLAPLICTCLAVPVQAQSYDQVVQAEILPGWRNSDGSHMAAIRITLNPGWKTYWRAPGDAGIPPQLDFRGSHNLAGFDVNWPTPEVFSQNGMRSIGYTEELVLPVRITPKSAGKPVRLKAALDIGVCRDICVPQQLTVKAELPSQGKRDARIAAAIADRPLSANEAGVRRVTCRLSPTQNGIKLTAKIEMPSAGGGEVAVIEAANPEIWVAEGTSKRQGNALLAETELMHVDGASFIVDRSTLRFTVLGANHAVDINGCTG
ncbi:disulfide bond corrector protein DsbC [Shimia abyssi]|uniref:Disulfide bond corrector protein DsbC n=2 Tax=Shimia abyssi TaxID=1662395 RepID=A0A2P8F906_9RHOB|nr:disulfide bond corrector protein DsbC [Shimia abyssi]